MAIMVEVPAIQCGVSLVNRSLLAVGVGTQEGEGREGAKCSVLQKQKTNPNTKKIKGVTLIWSRRKAP